VYLEINSLVESKGTRIDERLADPLKKLSNLERFVLAPPPAWVPPPHVALPRSALNPAYIAGLSAWASLTHLDIWATTFPPKTATGFAELPPTFALRTLLLKEVTISGKDLEWLLGSTLAAGSLRELALVYVVPRSQRETDSLASYISTFLAGVAPKLEKVHVELDHDLLAEPFPALPAATHIHLGGRGIGTLPASFPKATRFRLSFTPLILPAAVLTVPLSSESLSSLEIDTREPSLRTQIYRDIPAAWDFTRDELVQLNRLCRARGVRFLYGGVEFEEPSGDEAEEDELDVDLDAPFQLTERAIQEYEREREEDRRIRATRAEDSLSASDASDGSSDSSMI
jgi:hypothetical protein